MKKLLAGLLGLSLLLTGCGATEDDSTSAEILRVEESTSEEGEPAINVYFKFKNDTDEGKEFMYNYLIYGYQNGVQLTQVRNDKGYYTKIKDGAEIEGYVELILQDESPVELELQTYEEEETVQELTYEFE